MESSIVDGMNSHDNKTHDTLLHVSPSQRVVLESIVDMHQQTFPRGLLTCLGRSFLIEYYETILSSPAGGIIICQDNGNVVGYIAYTTDTHAFNREPVFRRAKITILFNLLTFRLNPILLLRAVKKRRMASPVADLPELLAIAVAPNVRRGGIGGVLLSAMETDLKRRGVSKYCVFTDNEEGIRFYRKNNFETVFCFQLGRTESACFTRELRQHATSE